MAEIIYLTPRAIQMHNELVKERDQLGAEIDALREEIRKVEAENALDEAKEYEESKAFQQRADLLRPMFGLWDAYDPVSHAILDVVEAQRELSGLFFNVVTCDGSNDKAQCKAAVEKRHAAGERLMKR